MAITVTLSINSPGSTQAGQRLVGNVKVVNNGSNTITVRDIRLSESSTMGAMFGQPDFLTPNTALESSYPSILTTATAYYPFSIVVPSPNMPGAPVQAPNSMHLNVSPPSNTWFRCVCDVRTYDATAIAFVVGQAELNFPVVSAVAAAISQGGSLSGNSGMNAVNWFFF